MAENVSRIEEHQEDLKWGEATFDGAQKQKGILHATAGRGKQVVHLQKLDFGEKKKELLERFIGDVGDHQQFLQKLKDRFDRVSLDIPAIEVRFENLNAYAEVYVGKRALPSITNSFLNMIERPANYLHILPSLKKKVSILQNCSGVIKPGRMTLLLGPPGSGKTTLLLALSGKLRSEHASSGKVTYNGHEMHEFVAQRTSLYVGQSDVHIAEMTVRETLAFSARCQGDRTAHDTIMELLRREKEMNIKPDFDIDIFMKTAVLKGQKENVITDYFLKILGLEECAETIIGNGMVRGISGGQKRRVTIGEMMVGPFGAFFMDNISTGLDSVSTFRIINSIRHSVHIFNKTALISLLQPPPETYNLFDDIIFVSEGQIVYQGPSGNILDFFETMGFICPHRKAVADYLLEVTSRKDQKQYWANKDMPYRYISTGEFAEAFQSFHIGRGIQRELSYPFDGSKCHPAALAISSKSSNKMELLKACFSRECILMKRNSSMYIIKILQHIIIAIIAATIFSQTKRDHKTLEDGIVHEGALFAGVLATLFTGFFELPLNINKLPVFYKQRNIFYPSWAYSLPASISGLPVSIVEVALWIATTYYIIGFNPNIKRMFRQFLLLAMSSQMSYGLFRCIAALSRDHNVANTGGNIAINWLLVFSSFALSQQDMKKWLIWGYWTSPLMYVLNAISTNEFLSGDWNHALNNSTESIGTSALKSRGMFTNQYWYWIGIGALAGFIFLFFVIYTLALAYLNPLGRAVLLSDEALNENHATRTYNKECNETVENNTHSTNDKTLKNASAIGMYQKGDEAILPFKNLSVTFENIRYSVDIPQETEAKSVHREQMEILKGVSGAFRPGVLTALMGVSGAGKTTLLDLLAGWKNTGFVEGSISISGYPKKQETFARVFGYCEQHGTHSPLITVYESLVFSAWLRLPSEVNPVTRENFVEVVMELIELTPLRDALVGSLNVNGLSIEQRKRMTIAIELVANPSIIFMDEPTSGLDARAASIVMRVVRNIVDTGRTVVCTIHQPSIDSFEAFDELFLLSQEGEEIYVGPLGHQSGHMIKYFEEIEGVSRIKDGYNPATWVMEQTTGAQEELLGVKFANIYKKSDLFRQNRNLIMELSSPQPNSKDLQFTSKYSQSFLTQFKVCLWRQHKSYWRNTKYNFIRFLYGLLAGFMLGIVFMGLGSRRRTKQDVFNGMGSMYTAVMFMGTNAASSVLPIVTAERAHFYRERAAYEYSAVPYAIAQIALEIPYTLAQALIYVIITYPMIGFEMTMSKFFQYLFFMFFTLLYFVYYGMMMVSLTPNHETAAILCGIFYTVWNLFSGFLIPRTRIPAWLRWYEWLCPISWSLYGLATSQYGDMQSKLDTGETVAAFMRRYFGYRYELLDMVSFTVIVFGLIFGSVFVLATKSLNFQKR